MQLFRNGYSLGRAQPESVATIGGFDGMHCGHQRVLARLQEIAATADLPTTVILFEPLPRVFFQRETAQQLCSLRARLEFLQAAGIKQVVCLSFNHRFVAWTAQKFIDDILVQGLKIRYLLIGDDFRFGRNREGSFTLLQQAGQAHQFQVERVTPLVDTQQRVSSTRIRQTLAAGDFATATRLLGRDYVVSGRVGHGDGKGKQLGFPTANLVTGKYPLPLQGVFIGEVVNLSLPEDAQAKPCLINAGYRPTFAGQAYQFEVYILWFEGNLYGQRLQVRPLKKLRDEKQFDTVAELQKSMQQDLTQAIEFWSDG